MRESEPEALDSMQLWSLVKSMCINCWKCRVTKSALFIVFALYLYPTNGVYCVRCRRLHSLRCHTVCIVYDKARHRHTIRQLLYWCTGTALLW